MDRLPNEVSLEIVRCLANTHVPSLRSFSLVNSTFHHLATSFLFRDVCVRCSTSDELAEDVKKLLKVLVKYDCVLRVKTLFVEDFDRRRLKTRRYCWKQSDPNCGSMAADDTTGIGSLQRELFAKTHDSADGAAFWLSLTHLLGHLTALADIIFDVYTQFPPGALEVLHRSNPFCRLHLTRFRLQSLANGLPDVFDLQLMASPCLHSVAVYVGEPSNETTYDYNWDAAFDMIDGAAPRMEHVRIVDESAFRTTRGGFALRSPRRAPSRRRRFCAIPDGQARRRSIKSFGYNGPLADIVPDFMENPSFHGLRALEILPCYARDSEALEMLGTLPGLAALERLRVKTSAWPIELDSALTTLFTRLTGLRSLYYWSDDELARYLERPFIASGATLRELNVGHKTLDTATIQMLSEQLPQLHSICFPMERTLSLPPETDIYTALAKFPFLDSVTLIMTYNQDIRAPLRMWDCGRGLKDVLDEDGRKKARRLSNMAIDTELVRQIWLEITRDTPRSKSFMLKITYTSHPYRRDTPDYSVFPDYDFLRPEWQLRASCTDGPQEVEITNLDSWQPMREPAPFRSRGHDMHILDVFKSIWPSRKGSPTPLGDWWSLPLQFRRDMDDWSVLPCKCSKGEWYTCCRTDEII